jgi:alcohol dehydrogenase class IV
MIAIPTTSGTGAEVSPAAVLTLVEKELKVGISSQMQRPALAIVDPLLTISVPPHITASTGIDALCHAIEAYATKRFDQKEKPKTPENRPIYGGTNEFTDLFAEKAIELIAGNLRKAFNNGQNVEARTNLSLASLMAGISFTNAGLGVVHAMSFPLGGKFHIPHGIAIAATLPAVMEFNAASNFEIFRNISILMGENVEGLSDREAALRSAKAVKELCRDVDIPNISSFGIKREDLPLMASETMKIQRLLAGNPRIASEQDILKIFQNAFEG